MLKNYTSLIKYFLTPLVMLALGNSAFSQQINRSPAPADTSIYKTGTKPAFRWKDSYLDRFNFDLPQSPLFYLYPKTVETSVIYEPENDKINVDEKIGEDITTKIPTAMSFNEYSSIQNAMVRKSILRDYERLQDGNSNTSGRGLSPLLKKSPLVDKLFGGKVPEFKPNGFISIDLRAGSQFLNNPETPLFLRKRPIFDFDQQISINFNNNANEGENNLQGGQGGFGGNNGGGLSELKKLTQGASALENRNPYREKMGILGNFDTKSAFNFENQFKLNFKSDPEDILQSLEAGNVSFPVNSQLIPGVENLFGVKAGLRFGKLNVSTVVAQQRSRTESILINGGAQNRPFEIRSDEYDENRHFFLSHFFRDRYEASLKSLPMVTSGVLITRVEVYVTNRTNSVNSNRNLVGVTDLGELDPYSAGVTSFGGTAASNDVNSLNELLKTEVADFRQIDNTNTALEAQSLKKGIDFEILRGAKRLTDREFDFNPQLGYISLLTPLRNDEILAVSYEYTINGERYQVGELTEDYSIRKEDDVIMMKLLKSSTIRNKLDHPMWDLMMKNVYSLSQGQIDREGFQLRIIYKDDATGMDVPNLQEGENLKEKPLIAVFGLDRLNYNNDQQIDGNFDYVEGITINENRGTIFFPVLEPFGSYLGSQFNDVTEATLKQKYVFDELYDKTISDAQQVNTKNKFYIAGSVQSKSTEIPLPLGASGASVRVYSGGTELQQGTDYMVDSQIGRIRIVNPSILASGRSIRIDYERPDLFQAQIRRLFGLRMDYSVNKSLRLGATLMDLKENTPGFLTRTAIGNEPVNNTLWGFDVNFKREGNGFTRLLDKLPLIQTKEPSSIILSAEFAQLIPGVNNKKIDGNAMIDDFEAARNINDLTRQPRKWRLGSTPDKFKDLTVPTYGYNYKRAKMSVYTIDQSTFITSGFGSGNGLVPEEITNEAQNNLYERSFQIQDIFPGRSRAVLGQNLPTAILDVSYFPEERGMYNYNPDLTPDGLLQNPEENFGAISRGITFDADFDNSNVEYLEFWLLNPFQDPVRDGRNVDGTVNQTGGVLSIQLGDISEDVIPDSRFNFENGIPTFSETASQPDITNWGKAPTVQFLTDAFDNSADSASFRKQDVGLDGLSNEEERNFEHIKEYLDKVKGTVTNQEALAEIINDPSGDDFKFFLDNGYGTDQFIVERFKNYLGMENNSPAINDTDVVTPASSAVADKEDLNQDNTISDVESYWNYDIPLAEDGLSVGNGYIIDKVSSGNADWYLFRVPLRSDTTKAQAVGGITGFKSVRFMRMVMSEWKEPVVLRFAALQLVSNSYRAYTEDLNNNSFVNIPEPNSTTTGFKVSTVSIEENGCTEDGDCNIKDGQTPYVVPPGFQRDRDFSQQSFRQFNEQSVSLAVEALEQGDKRAIFKNTELDLNMYKRVQMFVHAENEQNQDNYAGAFMRLGTDSKTNYYEVEIENLKATPIGSILPEDIWPEENEFDIPIDEFRDLKVRRNSKLGSDPEIALNKPYSEYVTVNSLPTDAGAIITRTYKITVVGNPDLSNILVTMLGISNPEDASKTESAAKFTVWMNELRANGFDDTKGEAAVLAADIKLADLGTISVSGNIRTFGFGGVQDRISSRSQETSQGFGIASSLELDKFFPQSWGLSIPLFMNYDIQEVVPHFDPLDPDIVLENALAQFDTEAERRRYKDLVIDRNVNKGFNLANVRKIKTNPNAKNHIYDIENFSVSYAQSSISRSNILIDEYLAEQKTGALTYQFQPKTTLWEPFKDKESLAKPKYAWIKALNFSPIPNLIAFRTDFNRSFTKTAYRSALQTENPGQFLDSTNRIAPNYIKYFLTNRYYDLQWDLTKSISMTYNARMNSIIDEEYGDAQESIWQGIFNAGRAKNYTQGLQLTYKLPLDKFFFLDWINANSRFNTDYQYRANSFDYANNESLSDFNGDTYGNFIENGRELAIQGRIDLVKLYNKLKYLKFANSPNQPKERFTRAPGDDEEIILPTSDFLKTFTRLLMTVRGINFNYSIVETTILPGFLPEAKLLGLSDMNSAPGLPFALLGSQNRSVLKDSTGMPRDYLSNSVIRNDPFTQTRQKKFDFSTNLEPFKGFRMQIRGNYSKGDSYQEIYRPTPESEGEFQALNPFRNGTFSMSFWSFKTGFTKMSKDPEDNYKYDIFDNMKAYRDSVIIKLQELNTSGETGKWDKNSQDVLIPAFFAAYSGKDIDKLFDKVTKKGRTTFNPFLQFPLPNWRIDYTGLEKLPFFNKLFNNITLSHSYSSTYSVGNFTSSLLYSDYDLIGLDNNGYSLGSKLSTYNNFSPVFIMSSITMEERFSPLIGVQFTTKANISGRVDFNRERRASLNLANAQIAEYNSNDIVFGVGFKKNNVKLPFRGRDGNNIILTNDLNFRFDVTIRDVTALQRRLDGDAVPIQGNYNLQIKPQVQYQFNKKLSMGFYFERFVNKPFTSLSYETRRTVGGLNMKFNLAD